MNAATLSLRVDAIEAGRQRTRRLRFLVYAVILIAVAWSIQVIVVRDTDWSRISAASLPPARNIPSSSLRGRTPACAVYGASAKTSSLSASSK